MLIVAGVSGVFLLAALVASVYLVVRPSSQSPVTSAEEQEGPEPTLSEPDRERLRQSINQFDNLPPEAKDEILRLLTSPDN